MAPSPTPSTPSTSTSSRSRRSSGSSARSMPSSGQRPRGARRGRGGRAKTNHTAATPASRELSKLEALPPTLFHHVLAFCLPCTHKSPQQTRSHAERALDEIALWSKVVRTTALEIGGQLALGKLVLDAASGSRKELLELRRQLLHGSLFVRDLELRMVSPPKLALRPAEQWLRQVVAQLAMLVRLVPRLELLDLRGCWGDVSAIVDAAASNCLQLKALLLPGEGLDPRSERGGQAIDRQPLMDAVFAGLQRWHRHNGGLRQLRLPSRQATNSLSSSSDFLLRVYTYCPSIELLDDMMTTWKMDLVQGGDEWLVDRTVWERFCERCTQLREFNWAMAPWATDFFEIFGRHTKPRLTDLTLATTMKWDWPKYFDEVGRSEASAIKTSGFGATANRVHKILQACPALKRLTVIVNSRVGTDEESLDAILDLEEYDSRDPPLPLKKENAMSHGLISDNLCKALVRHCPLLERFCVHEDHQQLAVTLLRVRPIKRFTDVGLQTLARLPRLSQLDLKAVSVTGVGLFDLVTAQVIDAAGTRTYDLTIGDEQGETAKLFYSSMQDFLQRLLNHKGELELPHKKVYMCVVNGNTGPVDASWSVTSLGRLKGVLRALRRKHPTITFRVEIEGLTNREFATIFAFGFYTAGATLPIDSRWLDLPQDALEEDVFVLEEVMDEHDDEDAEIEEEDDDDDEYYDDDDDHEFDSEDDDEEGDDDNHGEGGYYGDYRNERGHYGMGGVHFFNGLQLPDIGALRIRDDEGDGIDGDDHEFYDHAGYDY